VAGSLERVLLALQKERGVHSGDFGADQYNA
jgi:hypothetical protein